MRFLCFLLVSICLLASSNGQLCDRCVCPCSQNYCVTSSSRTWNSSYAFSLTGYTKLVLSNDGTSCKPCAYSCQTCTSENYTSCTVCMPQFYLSPINSSCLLCSDRCTTCTILNNITTCTLCSTGSYLDSLTGLCLLCASGAYSCDSLQITACAVGYYQVSPIVCLPCISNCQSCSTSQCSVCNTGYYKNTSGSCLPCNTSLSCLTCVTNTTCASCAGGFYLTTTTPRKCLACAVNCVTCTSTVCSQCSPGFYLNSGTCSAVSLTTIQCSVYSTSNTCTACSNGYYLLNNSCLPCSSNCLTCIGSTFGQCVTCQTGFTLYNMMCLPINFPTSASYRLYYHLPGYAQLFSGGSLSTCLESVYLGNSISLNLSNLAASSITVRWKVYLLDVTTSTVSYNISFNSISVDNLTTSTFVSSICSNSSPEFYDQQSIQIINITLNNLLTFSSSSVIAVSEVGLLCVRCTSLCVVCTSTVCSQCTLSTLFTQADICVYTCSNSYYTYAVNNSCLTVCPQRTYTVSATLTCINCVSPCYTCTSNVSCLSCISGYYLYNNNCQTTCPVYYYANNISGACEKCVGRCLTCLSPTICLTCLVGFLQGTQCVDNCSTISGMYSNISTLSCQACSSGCVNCSDSSTRCTACSASQPYLINQTCYLTCPIYTYPSNSSCLSCSYPCLTCQNSSGNCTSCITNYLYNNICLSVCPNGYYEQTKNLTCVACQVGCNLCALTQSYCQDCASPYYYFNSSCLLQCPNGYYKPANSQICQQCVSPCLTCSNSSFCLSCMSNFLNQTTGKCVGQSECADSYYADISTLICLSCNASCLKCSVQSVLCTACASPLLLQGYSCISSCFTYFYPVVSLNKCAACIQPCLTCTNSTSCLSCISGYLFSNTTKQCLSYCSAGEYIDQVNSVCQSCGSYCLSCKKASSCQQCSNSYYLYPLSGACISNCSIVNGSYFSDETTSVCILCIQPCLTCLSVTDCASCLSGVLYQNRCIGSCPISTYASNGTCLNCSSLCFSCATTASNCTSCSLGTYLYMNQCLSSCPLGYYNENVLLICEQCNAKCSNCTNYTYCLTCLEGYLDSTNNCVDSCSLGFYAQLSDRTCRLCDLTCSSCSNISTNCITCATGYVLVQLTLSSSMCSTSCSSTEYSINGICYACSSPCLQCTSSTNCVSCIQGTILLQSSQSCVSVCPLSTYESNGICLPCASTCGSCANLTYCLTCTNSSLYVYLGGCYQNCPSQYYSDNFTKMCVECIAPCVTCTAKFTCLSCTEGFLLTGYCYDVCPPGTFSNATTNSCDQCQQPCLTCVINSAYCTKCLEGYYMYNGNCSLACPIGSYVNGGSCETCPYPCLTCLNQVVCTSCLGGFLNYLNASCISGPNCPNDMYNMDGVACVRATDCPSNYFKDTDALTCSSSCNLGKYTFMLNTSCLNSCPSGYYAGVNLVCQSFDTLQTTLLGATIISFVQSSCLYMELVFNETVEWDYPVTTTSYQIYTAYNYTRRRLLSLSSSSVLIPYSTTEDNQRVQVSQPIPSPFVTITLPAYYVKSIKTGLPLQTPSNTVTPHSFAQYSIDQMLTGAVINQISQSVSVIIVVISLGFLAINRLSDVYIIWDVSQLVYLLIFLDIQYPPNLNEFIIGLKDTHLYMLPNMFTMPTTRQNSTAPYYAYAHDVNFLRSAGQNMFLALVVIGSYLILKLFQCLINRVEKLKTYDKLRRFVFKGLLRYRWHYINDFFFLTFLNVMSFTVAQTQDLNSNYSLFGLCMTLMVISVICYIGFPIFVATKLYRHYGNIAKGKLIENLKCFYRGIEKTNKFGVSLILLRYFRKLVFAITIPILSSRPLLVLPILTMSSILTSMFIFIHKPFKKRISNIVNFLTEALLVCLFLFISIVYLMPDTYLSAKWVIGWIAVIMLALLLFGQMFYIFCKTLFYLEPQQDKDQAVASSKDPIALLRKNRSLMVRLAEQFFNKMFPNLKHNFSLDSSDEQDNHKIEEGDSQNSQNNEYFKQAMNIDDHESENHEEFRHYQGSETASLQLDEKHQPPKYMVRCIHSLPDKI